MDIFDLCPEELSAVGFIIALSFSKQFTEDDQLEILSNLFSYIGDNLGLIQAQRDSLAAKLEKCKADKDA